jgi:hypothetical protein
VEESRRKGEKVKKYDDTKINSRINDQRLKSSKEIKKLIA